jgi:DNA-binding SARP family transcriptional activator
MEAEQSSGEGLSAVRVETLGGFRVWREDREIPSGSWGREKAIHLFQFLVTYRDQPMHKEEIIDLLWPESDLEIGNRDFKVALNALISALEPERSPRAPSSFIKRNELVYGLNPDRVWIDAEAFEQQIALGNIELAVDRLGAIRYYRNAVELYKGDYLPERRYMDWSSVERERLQTLALGTMSKLAGMLLDENPLESIRLSERVLKLDPVWEEAARVEMKAYLATGNRPLALRAYQRCAEVLQAEYGLEPLPETRALYAEIVKSD